MSESSRARDVRAASAEPGTKPAIEPADRPAASGHRFGPDLACSECGIHWDAHQRSPAPCGPEEEPAEAFLRRPSIDEPRDLAAPAAAATPIVASKADPSEA